MKRAMLNAFTHIEAWLFGELHMVNKKTKI